MNRYQFLLFAFLVGTVTGGSPSQPSGYTFEFANSIAQAELIGFSHDELAKVKEGEPSPSGARFTARSLKSNFGTICQFAQNGVVSSALDTVVEVKGFEGSPTTLVTELGQAGVAIGNPGFQRLVMIGQSGDLRSRVRTVIDSFRGTVRELLVACIPALPMATPNHGPFLWHTRPSDDQRLTVVYFGQWDSTIPRLPKDHPIDRPVRKGIIRVISEAKPKKAASAEK